MQDSERVEASLCSLRQAVLDMHRVVRKRRYGSARAVPAERHMIDLSVESWEWLLALTEPTYIFPRADGDAHRAVPPHPESKGDANHRQEAKKKVVEVNY